MGRERSGGEKEAAGRREGCEQREAGPPSAAVRIEEKKEEKREGPRPVKRGKKEGAKRLRHALWQSAPLSRCGCLGPDLEQRVPRSRGERLTVLRDPQTRHAVVVSDQLVDQSAELRVPNVAEREKEGEKRKTERTTITKTTTEQRNG